MKKLVLLSFVLTVFAFGLHGQISTATDQAADGKGQINSSGTKINSDGTQPASVQDQKTADASKSPVVEKKGCFKISSVSLASGMNKYRTMGYTGFNDEISYNGHTYRNVADGGFMNGRDMGNITSRNQVTLEMGLNPWSKKLGDYNKKRELVIGLYYSGSNLEDRYSEKYAGTPGDTFSFNSIKYKTDTLSRITHFYGRGANVLGGRVEYLFKSDPERRFSVFTGVGVDVAYAITTEIRESIIKDSSIVLNFYNNSSSSMDFMDTQTNLGSEEIMNYYGKGDPTFFTGVSVPFGINLRLCKKKVVLNQFSLFLKGRMGVEAEFAVNNKPHFNPFMGMSMGLKFDFK